MCSITGCVIYPRNSSKMEDISKKNDLDVCIEDIRSCWKVPAIAHFCSLFRGTFLLPDFEIEELEEALFLDAGVEQSDFLTNLVVQLLRGIHGRKTISCDDYLKWLRSVMKDRWELTERRVNPLNSQDVTFKMLPTLTKVEILHALCDYRLDAADVSVLKDYDGDNLRVEPLGTDRTGATYWYFYGTRLYKEDRQLTQEEREAKHKQKLKEKRKRKKERLKTIKKMKEARKKQKQKDKGKKGRMKAGCKEKKKKKKCSKESDEEGLSEPVATQGLKTSSVASKNTKKELKRKNTKSLVKSTPSKIQKLKDSCIKKKFEASEVINSSKKKNEEKSKRTNSKKPLEKRSTSGKKRQTVSCTDKRKCKTTLSKKKKTEESRTTATKNQSKITKSATSSTSGNKTSKELEHNESASKTRKRKVVKSKAIISESEDSDDDQPLKKLAKNHTSHKGGSKAISNKQKPSKTQTGNRRQSNKTQSKRTSSSRSKANIKTDENLTDTRKGKNQRNIEEMSKWSSEEDISSAVSFPDSSESDSDSEDDVDPPRWHLVCHTQDDWQQLTDTFKKSKVKCEKELYKTLANDFLPEIHSLFAAKEKALRKKLQELAPRRASSRVVIMQLKREEEERLKSIEEAEQSSKRQQAEEEKREKMKLRNKQPVKKEQSKDNEPSKVKGSSKSNQEKSKKSKKVKAKARSKSIHACLQQVYDAVSNHEDSWPFVDPVDEAYAPAYYQIIIKPMCLSTIQKKVNKKEYKTKEEFERDMNQLFTNCLEYNGPGNEYTLMAENLKSCLEYNMEQVFPKQDGDKDRDSDSDSDSIESDHYVHQRPPQRQSARNANTRLEKLEDKVYARLRGLSSNESSVIESQDSSRVDSGDDNDTEMNQSENDEASCDAENESGQDKADKGLIQEDESEDLKVTTKGNSPTVSPRSTSPQNVENTKSSLAEVAPSNEQTDMQTCAATEVKPAVHSPRNDDQNVPCASKGVIAFARSSSVHEPPMQTNNKDNVSNQERDQSNKGNKEEPTDSNKESAPGQASVSQMGCKEESTGHQVTTVVQGTSASRVNRVKPIQNVRPYIPDSHSKEDSTSFCAPQDQHERTHQATQGLPAMIDLNSRRPDVLKPLMSSSSDGNATSYNQNSLAVNFDLNKAVPQGNIYTTSSLDLDFQHSKQSEHSGTKSKHQQRKSKSKNLPELPAPLTVPPVQQAAHQHVPSVQPLLASTNSVQATHWHQQPSSTTSGGIFQQPAHIPPSSAKESGENSSSESPQKFWHPLGREDKFMSNYAKSSPTLYPHGGPSPGKQYPEPTKESKTSRNEMPQASEKSGNILQSLLHKQSNASESHQSRNECKSPFHGPNMAPIHTSNDKQSNSITQDHSLSSKSGGHSKLPPSDIGYHEARGLQITEKEEQQYLSRGYDYGKNMSQTELNMKTSMPTASSHTQQEGTKLHQQAVEPTVTKSTQLVERPSSNAIQDMETFVAKQEKLVSASHYSHTYPFPSNVSGQIDYGKDKRQTDSARLLDSAISGRNSGSYLSMLASDSRDMKDYKDRLGAEGFPRPHTAYSQGHSSLYTEQRMRASQASPASFGYSSGANLSHLLPPRQTPVGQSNSAFTPHDPYSSQSAFRTQRPTPAIYPQYVSPQEAEHLTRQQFQQHVHHRSGIGSGLVPYHARPPHAHPDIAYYTQRGISGPLLGSQGVGSVRPRMPYDPSLLSHPSHMQGYK